MPVLPARLMATVLGAGPSLVWVSPCLGAGSGAEPAVLRGVTLVCAATAWWPQEGPWLWGVNSSGGMYMGSVVGRASVLFSALMGHMQAHACAVGLCACADPAGMCSAVVCDTMSPPSTACM